MMKILQAASEYSGLAKTGGLADMVGSLSLTLARLGHDVRVCLPAYSGIATLLVRRSVVARLRVSGHEFKVIEGYLEKTAGRSDAQSEQCILLLDCPALFNRGGDPYRDESGNEFVDNWKRFGAFSEAVAALATGSLEFWEPDVVHLHDWHCGLAAPWIKEKGIKEKGIKERAGTSGAPGIVFTVHNFSFQGHFDGKTFRSLRLPENWWSEEGVRHGAGFSFMKAGLYFSDAITAVSPRYAEEIQTPEFGAGLETAAAAQGRRLHGIVNGIDEAQWDPSNDGYLFTPYDSQSVIKGKRQNKNEVQRILSLSQSDGPLLVFIGRLAEQKGPDLMVGAREFLKDMGLQIVVLGTGDHEIESQIRQWAAAEAEVAAVFEVDEAMAHLLTAAADMQLMPSRFEPCGLSQMYAQRYGTIPVATRTGGLADTIVSATPETLADGSATGVLFDSPTVEGLSSAVNQAVSLMRDRECWHRMQIAGMQKDFSWRTSARRYVALYESIVNLATC